MPREEVPAFYYNMSSFRISTELLDLGIPVDNKGFSQELAQHREFTDRNTEEGALFLKLLEICENQRRHFEEMEKKINSA